MIELIVGDKIMSLVLAKKVENKIILLCDTRITNVLSNLPKPPGEGISKIRIVNDDVMLGFAGNVDILDSIFASIVTTDGIENLKSFLFCERERCNRSVDFILCSIAANKIFKLSGDNWEDVEDCWIGSQNAYVTFRGFETGRIDETFLKPSHQNTGIFSVIRQLENVSDEARVKVSNILTAFINVVEKTSIPDVGDFCIAYVEEFGVYRPLNYFIMRNNNLVLPEPSPEPQILPAGTVEDGSYAFEFMAINPSQKFAGFFLLQGGLGFLFPIGLNDMGAKILKAENSIDFEFDAREDFDLDLNSGFSNVQNYLALGTFNLNQKQNFQKAFWIFDKGVRVARETDPYAKVLLAHRGLMHSILSDDVQAMRDCNGAIDSADFKMRVYECRAIVHSRAGRWQEAAHDYEVAVTEEPDIPLLFERLASCYQAIGDITKMAEKLAIANKLKETKKS